MWYKYALLKTAELTAENIENMLGVTPDVANFVAEIADNKSKGLAFNALKQNPLLTINDLRQLTQSTNLTPRFEEHELAAVQGFEESNFKKWAIINARQNPNIDQEQIRYIYDWYRSVEPTPDIASLSVQQAYERASRWHETLGDATAQYPANDEENIVAVLSDGFTMRNVTSSTCKAEGSLMEHCVGGYGDAIDKGESKIESLRDKHNRPHVTLEYVGDENKITQIYGKKNTPVSQAYIPYLKEYFTGTQNTWGLVYVGTLDEVKSFYKQGFRDMDYVLFAGVANCDIDKLNWAVSLGAKPSPFRDLPLAIMKGSLPVFNRLVELGCVPVGRHYNDAIRAGRMNILHRLLELSVRPDTYNLEECIKNKRHDMFDILLQAGVEPSAMVLDATFPMNDMYAFKKMINWGLKPDEFNVTNAVRADAVEMFDILVKMGCKITPDIIDTAIASDSPKTLSRLLELGFEPNKWQFLQAKNKPELLNIMLQKFPDPGVANVV